MELDQVLQKRVRGMAVRILANIENLLACHLDAIGDGEKFELTGAELKILRGEVLNAAGDTTRSLISLLNETPKGLAKISLPRELLNMLGGATAAFVQDGEEEIPVFRVRGDFGLLTKIRDLIGAGVVYNNMYTCVGIDAIVDSLIPAMDKIQLAGIKIAGGHYKTWREDVCEMYLEGLGDE